MDVHVDARVLEVSRQCTPMLRWPKRQHLRSRNREVLLAAIEIPERRATDRAAARQRMRLARVRDAKYEVGVVEVVTEQRRGSPVTASRYEQECKTTAIWCLSARVDCRLLEDRRTCHAIRLREFGFIWCFRHGVNWVQSLDVCAVQLQWASDGGMRVGVGCARGGGEGRFNLWGRGRGGQTGRRLSRGRAAGVELARE